MDIKHQRKERLRDATRSACADFTKGMKKPELRARLEKVRGMVKASTDREGRPFQGLGERVTACKEEIARLEKLVG